MELLGDAGLVKGARLAGLTVEAGEILAMVVSSIKTARSK
jgi:hypothetical protein